MESVILQSPLLLTLLGVAFGAMVLSLFVRPNGFALLLIAFAFGVAVSVISIFFGASLFEAAVILTPFPLVALLELRWRKRE